MFTAPICHFASSGEAPLLNFNPGELGPPDQPMPLTSAAMTALGLPAPVGIWGFDESSGNIIDRVGNVDLVPSAGMRHNKLAPGLTGTQWLTKIGVEFDDGDTDQAESASTSDLDITTGSFAFFIIVRQIGRPATTRCLARKQNTDLTPGWHLEIGQFGPEFEIRDSLGNRADAGGTLQIWGGPWHYFMGYVDRSVDEMGLFCSAEDEIGVDCSGVTASMTNAFSFGVGAYGSRDAPQCTIPYMAFWTGANAESLAQNWAATHFPVMWTRGKDPTGALNDQKGGSRDITNTIIGENANGLVCGYHACPDQGAEPGNLGIQFPWAWNSGLTTPLQMGVAITAQVNTLVDYSDDFDDASWVATNLNKLTGADLMDAPDGFFNARCLESTAAGAYVQDTIAVSASQLYTMDVFAIRNTAEAGDVSGCSIEAYDLSNGATIANTPFTATDEWQRIVLEFTTPVGCVSMGFRINVPWPGSVDTKINVWRATLIPGELSNPIWCYAGTRGDRNPSVKLGVLGTVAGTYMKAAQGEITAHYICHYDNDNSSNRFLLGTESPDQKRFRINSSEQNECFLTNGAGAGVGTFTEGVKDQSLEHTVRFKWDANNPLPSGRYTEIYVDGVLTAGVGAVAGWVPGVSGNTDFWIGAAQFFAEHLNGILVDLKVYENPQLP